MPKKPRKQHVTHYMNPNPWENPKGFKKPKKVKKEQTKVSGHEWALKKHLGLKYGGTHEFSIWQSHIDITTVTNSSVNDPVELVWDEDGRYYTIRKVNTPEHKAQQYIDQYPGANPVDLMIAYHNEGIRKAEAQHKKVMAYKDAKYRSACETISTINQANQEMQLELVELRQQIRDKQAQFERIVSVSITATESVRHFREED